jgi:hypothetical protein
MRREGSKQDAFIPDRVQRVVLHAQIINTRAPLAHVEQRKGLFSVSYMHVCAYCKLGIHVSLSMHVSLTMPLRHARDVSVHSCTDVALPSVQTSHAFIGAAAVHSPRFCSLPVGALSITTRGSSRFEIGSYKSGNIDLGPALHGPSHSRQPAVCGRFTGSGVQDRTLNELVKTQPHLVRLDHSVYGSFSVRSCTS